MYYLTFVIGLVLAMFNEKRNLLLKLYFLILLMLASFRYGVGSDYFNYEYLYQRLQNSPINELKNGIDSQELGFRFLGSLLKSLGIPYELYLIFFATINLIYVYKLCKDYSKNPTMSLVLYFAFYYLVWTFSGIRQGLVLSVGMYYLVKYCTGKFSWKYIFIVLILSTIHSSGIILIMLYTLARVNFTKGKLLMIFSSSLFIAVMPLHLLFSKIGSIPVIGQIRYYLTDEYSFFNVIDFQSLARILFVIIIFFYYEVYSERSELDKKIINIYILSISLYFFFKFSELTAARLSIYGKYLDILLLVNIYYLYKQKLNRFIYILLLLCITTLYFLKELNSLKDVTGVEFEQDTLIVPYTSILDKEIIPLKPLPLDIK